MTKCVNLRWSRQNGVVQATVLHCEDNEQVILYDPKSQQGFYVKIKQGLPNNVLPGVKSFLWTVHRPGVITAMTFPKMLLVASSGVQFD
jgi:hypothetical protein